MTPMQPDKAQGTLAPGAALTIAATLLGGANEQTVGNFTQLLTQRERGLRAVTTEPAGSALTAEEIERRVVALLPEIRERGDEIASLRRLPRDLVDTLKQAGAFRMPMPMAWGGPEMSLRRQIELVEALAGADPSVGWCVMIGSDAGFYSAFLDDDAGRELWSDLDDVTAGWVFPAGRAVPVEGGFRVSGRWQFGSGCTHADVIVGGCLVMGDDGSPAVGADGLPVGRIVVARADQFEIIDTWFTTGLAGSGSNDYHCQNVFVPADHTFSLREPVRRPGALFAFPGSFFANMQGVGLGLARRAIDEVVGIATTKVLMPQLVTMRDVPRVREAVAEAEGKLRAVRAYVYDAIDAVWERLCAGEPLSDQERIDLILSRVQSFRVARDVAMTMVQLAGTQAIYTSSVLDRLLRDAVTINQHAVAGPVMIEAAGQLKLGQQPTGPLAAVL